MLTSGLLVLVAAALVLLRLLVVFLLVLLRLLLLRLRFLRALALGLGFRLVLRLRLRRFAGAFVVLVAVTRAGDAVVRKLRLHVGAIIPGADLDFDTLGVKRDISRFGFGDLDDFAVAIDLHADLRFDRRVADVDHVRPADEQVAAQNGLLEDDRIHRNCDDAAGMNLACSNGTGDVHL